MRLLFALVLASASLFGQSHQYWRLAGQSSNLMSIGNVVFYTSGGSTISTSGGTATSSTNYPGQTPNLAFTGDTSCGNFWLANGSGTQWLEMTFTSAVAVDHIAVTYGCNGGRGFPIFLQLQYSDNNSSWTTANEWDGASSGGGTITTTFTPANAKPASPAIWWRLQWTVASGCLGMNNLAFFSGANATGSSLSLSRYAATASSISSDPTGPYGAIAAQTNGYESSSSGTINYVYAFGSIQSVGSIQFSNSSVGGCGQVNNLTIQYSLDNSSWTTTNTYTPTWTGTQTKTFNVTGSPGGYAPQVGGFLVGP